MSRLSAGIQLVYLISDGTLRDGNFKTGSARFVRLLKSAVENRIPLVQIREKAISARNLLELTERASAVCRGSGTLLLVNDRADIAVMGGAAGVHLTGRSVPATSVRRDFPRLLIGASAHSEFEITGLRNAGADFTVLSPVFDSPGKGEPLGIGRLRRAAIQAGGFPVLGLGGIDAGNFRSVLDAAAGFAAIRYLNSESNLNMIGRELYGKPR